MVILLCVIYKYFSIPDRECSDMHIFLSFSTHLLVVMCDSFILIFSSIENRKKEVTSVNPNNMWFTYTGSSRLFNLIETLLVLIIELPHTIIYLCSVNHVCSFLYCIFLCKLNWFKYTKLFLLHLFCKTSMNAKGTQTFGTAVKP